MMSFPENDNEQLVAIGFQFEFINTHGIIEVRFMVTFDGNTATLLSPVDRLSSDATTRKTTPILLEQCTVQFVPLYGSQFRPLFKVMTVRLLHTDFCENQYT